jgi:hypothetical protein
VDGELYHSVIDVEIVGDYEVGAVQKKKFTLLSMNRFYDARKISTKYRTNLSNFVKTIEFD